MGMERRKSAARFNRRNRLKTNRGWRRLFCKTPYGRKVLADFLEPITEFLAGNLTDKPEPPPEFLQPLTSKFRLDDHRALAAIGLSRLLDPIFRGWDPDDPSADAKLFLQIGRDLYSQYVKGVTSWTEKQCLLAGAWLFRQVMGHDFFAYDDDGFPTISDKWQFDIDQLREELIRAHPVHMPLFDPPPDWAGWWTTYPSGYSASFVRHGKRPICEQSKAAIIEALVDPEWEHAKGVNALQRVPFKIDPVMRDLVKRHAPDVMRHTGQKRKADEWTVREDVETAEYLGDRPFYIPRNIDKRGRINAVCHFNFDRGDHVRSLFRFARGMNLDREEGTFWLEVHCANCHGEDGIDKRSWDERREWVSKRRRDLIEKVAIDPDGTLDLWKGVDSPFCFVAACRELVAAWDDQENFETHLPIGFDGSCNGLQHLAYIARDPVTGYMVNICPDPHGIWPNAPQDVYAVVIAETRRLLELDEEEWARWWLDRFNKLGEGKTRKLIKKPAMSYAYSATLGGMRDQIKEVYEDFGDRAPYEQKRPKGKRDGCSYLAGKIIEACKLRLKEPTKVMECVRTFAESRMNRGLFLEWTTPSGFPVSNFYHEPKKKETVGIMRSSVRLWRNDIIPGYTDEIDKTKTLNASAPNLVHSLDAAHLIKVVNAARESLIRDIITTHDCYYCLASVATNLNRIIRFEMGNMYNRRDVLADLGKRNIGHDHSCTIACRATPISPVAPRLLPLFYDDALQPQLVNFSEFSFS